MRIALIADSISRTNGGIAPVMYALAGKIAAQGHEVCLFGTDDSYAAGDCTAAGVAWHTAPALWRKGIRYAPGLKRLLREFAPDLVHIHGIWCYAELAAADMHLPYIVSPHGMLDPWALKNSQWKKKIFAALFEHRVFENAAAIHALCKAEAEETEVFHPGKRIVTIPNGIDLPPESSPFPAVDGKKELLFLGRLHPKKGAAGLIQAFGQLQPENWRLVIAGWDQNNYAMELHRLAAQFPQADIIFPGPLFGEAKANAFRRSRAFILPSFSEGLPMTVLEAWAYGLPTLLTDFCNLPEGVAAGAAFRIEPEVEKLCRRLEAFFAEPDDVLLRMGGCARELAAHKFSWDGISESFLKLYASILDR